MSTRHNAHSLGDAAEALIAYSWLRDFFEIKETAEKFAEQIPQRKMLNRKTEKELTIQIFTSLLQKLYEKVVEGKNQSK
ncbi:MAG: hypothetical protein KIH08_12175 [Candidatus Freyarchaeota archaeon]|nr:hypothetical protein [Candidatus Jordarchaeia archaeon]